jgi:glycosyltransferase involved in cell wall biosynthesis
MRVAHILRKYNPAEWGGTETAVKRLLDGLRTHHTEVVVYCPECPGVWRRDPLMEAGHQVERFRAFVPVAGISLQQKEQLIAVGGNLMSFDLLWKLHRAPGLSVIHTHALNRLGGIAATVARRRRIPLVVTIHGGVLDLPAVVQQKLMEPLRGGVEWGKIFGWLLRSRRVLEQAQAIITCNRREAALLKEK